MTEYGHDNFSGFAASVNSRVAARARIVRAAAFAWLCGGLAITCCLAGLGVAAAYYGYSYMLSVKPAADLVAKALVDGIKNADIKSTVFGTMNLAPGTEL